MKDVATVVKRRLNEGTIVEDNKETIGNSHIEDRLENFLYNHLVKRGRGVVYSYLKNMTSLMSIIINKDDNTINDCLDELSIIMNKYL